jgi:hypothetical protein
MLVCEDGPHEAEIFVQDDRDLSDVGWEIYGGRFGLDGDPPPIIPPLLAESSVYDPLPHPKVKYLASLNDAELRLELLERLEAEVGQVALLRGAYCPMALRLMLDLGWSLEDVFVSHRVEFWQAGAGGGLEVSDGMSTVYHLSREVANVTE